MGRGIVKDNMALELFLGTSVHDGLAAIATQHRDGQVDINTITTTIHDAVYTSILDHADSTKPEAENVAYAHEQATLVEGILRGFYRQVWPILIQQYPTIVAVEQEMTYTLRDDLVFMAKPDLILAKEDGTLVYIEYKTTSSKSEQWVNSWGTAVQLHSSIKAVEQTLGQAPASVIVIGLYKGYQSYGKQSSPFCYCYQKSANPPFTEAQTAYEYKPGFKRSPVWELPGGVAQWVAEMPEEVLAAQFLQTPEIFIKDDMIEQFFAQVGIREFEIQQAMLVIDNKSTTPDQHQQFLNGFFPQHFEQCNPAYGRGCSFKMLCHGHVSEPLEQGWILREAHHAPEAEQHSQEN